MTYDPSITIDELETLAVEISSGARFGFCKSLIFTEALIEGLIEEAEEEGETKIYSDLNQARSAIRRWAQMWGHEATLPMLHQVYNDKTEELEHREMSPAELGEWAARLEERAEALLKRADDLYDGAPDSKTRNLAWPMLKLEVTLRSGNHADIAEAVERLERALEEYE